MPLFRLVSRRPYMATPGQPVGLKGYVAPRDHLAYSIGPFLDECSPDSKLKEDTLIPPTCKVVIFYRLFMNCSRDIEYR